MNAPPSKNAIALNPFFKKTPAHIPATVPNPSSYTLNILCGAGSSPPKPAPLPRAVVVVVGTKPSHCPGADRIELYARNDVPSPSAYRRLRDDFAC
jgi:hypothetical protein